MWKEISLFELRYQLRQPLFACSALAFFALAVGLASSDVGNAVGDAPGTTFRNAPIVVLRLMPVLSLLGLFVITAFVASAGLRDFERRSEMLFFTKPLGKADYLLGRFAGSMAVSFLVLLVAVAGLATASFAPWQPPERIGAFALAPYGFGLGVIIVPNLLVMGGFFFALAIWSRRLSLTFVCVVFFIGMQDAVELVAERFESRVLGSLLEPSGIVALENLARYWTIEEQQARLPELGGLLLANRLLWLGVAFLVLAISLRRFDFTARGQRPTGSRRWWRRAPAASTAVRSIPGVGREDGLSRLPRTTTRPRARRRSTPASRWRQLLRQTRIELSEVVAGAPFLTLLAFGLMFVIAYSFVAGMDNGTPSYPLTHLMLEAIQLGVRLTLILMVAFYAGELVFNQRSLKLSEVYDALPVPNGMFLAAKLLALGTVTAAFLLAATVSTIGVQLSKGFFQLELALYAKGLVIIAVPVLLLAVLAIFIQVLTDHKLLGLLLTAIALIVRFALPKLGFEHYLYRYASHPPITYSGINGYGHHLGPFAAFMVYWGFGALILSALTLLLWPRGGETSLGARVARIRMRMTMPSVAMPVVAMLGVGLVGMATVGGWIFWNTNVRNTYLDRDRIIQRLADYELTYRSYRDAPLPRVTSIYAEVDLYPERRQVEIRGRYRLENQGTSPIRILPITVSPRWVEGVLPVYGGVSLERIDLPAHRKLVEDESLGFYVLELAEPIAAGDAIDFGFAVRVDHLALANRSNNLVVANGTFFSDQNFFPFIGYARSNELSDPTEREKRGMPGGARSAELDDVAARERNYLPADWVQVETIVSTHADQIALAPGNLEREWTDGARRYFHYRTIAPVNIFAILSGSYAVRRDRWQGIDIEVYFDPDHAVNIDRFVVTAKESLAYMTAEFGPYPHAVLRIVEIPNDHGKIAVAFAGTIAFSESWSFSADLAAGDLDWLTGVLAHEVAHQWWNHQVIPADVQGATLLGESLAQYSAMMILERMYGRQAVRHFLKFHLDRYLAQRGSERRREMPLYRVENQDYLHYSKASLAFYALEDLVGEASVNRALRAFLQEFGFEGPPYATSRDLLAHLRRELPEEKRYLIEELFETITLFDNRVVEAEYSRQGDDRYVVEVTTSTRKLRDDGHGATTEVAVDDWIDIGVFGEKEIDGRIEETVLVLEKRRVRSAQNTFRFVVDERPVRAGIDPYNKLVDRISDDNVRTLHLVNSQQENGRADD